MVSGGEAALRAKYAEAVLRRSKNVVVPREPIETVRTLWRTLMGAPNGFADAPILVVGNGDHLAAPRGWVGLVRIESSAVVVSPPSLVSRIATALANADILRITDPDYIAAVLGPAEGRGPASLFYGYSFEPSITRRVVGPLPGENALVREVAVDATEEERDESGIEDCTSGFYVALGNDSRPAAICAWREWPCRVAHMSVLAASSQRGHGHAASASARALQAATQEGLLPQWRAAHWNVASIGLARRLGLAEVGQQYSVHVI